MTNLIPRELTDDFWNDCINTHISKKIKHIFPYKYFSKTFGRNNYRDAIKNKSKYLINLFSFQSNNKSKRNNNSSLTKYKHRTMENHNFFKIYMKHPMLHEKKIHSQENKELQKRKKNAMLRCHGLYAYGIEVKKEKMLNDENNKKEKMKQEILPCTFRPKISKFSQKQKARFLTDAMNKKKIKKNDKNNLITDYKISTNLSTYDNGNGNGGTKGDIKNKNLITLQNNEIKDKYRECTFHPKIYRRNIDKVFSQEKSLANEKDNDQFFLRYNKAREDYMSKKLKKLSTKDECYDTLLTIFNNFNNKHQRNKKEQNSMNDNKNEMGTNLDNKGTLNVDKKFIQSLRNELLSIDLNDDK